MPNAPSPSEDPEHQTWKEPPIGEKLTARITVGVDTDELDRMEDVFDPEKVKHLVEQAVDAIQEFQEAVEEAARIMDKIEEKVWRERLDVNVSVSRDLEPDDA